MNRQQAKELLPIIQEFAEGKIIQYKWNDEKWFDIQSEDVINIIKLMDYGQELRIKPEPKYRPFKDKEECWQEMLKHQPFGWVKAYHGQFVITEIRDSKAAIGTGRNNNFLNYDYIFKEYTFADGTPFGIKE